MASGLTAIELGIKELNFSVVGACAKRTNAMGEAFNLLKLSKADVMLAGGSKAAIVQLSFAGFCSMRAMSTSYKDDFETASRPFDSRRDGFVIDKGAGVLVLETLEHAKSHGAKIYCEIIWYAASCDAYHIKSPCLDGYGRIRCYDGLLAEAREEFYKDYFVKNIGNGDNLFKKKISSWVNGNLNDFSNFQLKDLDCEINNLTGAAKGGVILDNANRDAATNVIKMSTRNNIEKLLKEGLAPRYNLYYD